MFERAHVREVGLRDGLQMVERILSTDRKLAWCRAAHAAGIEEIEVTSFVPPSVVPQFADAAEVAAGALTIPGLKVAALVPNLKGASRAFDIGVTQINYVLSASEAHSLANVRRTSEASLDDFRRIVNERDSRGLKGRVRVASGIATSFGCTLQGHVPEARVVEIAATLAASGAEEIILADTVGYANPGQVRRIIDAVTKVVGGVPLAAHFHDTRGLGLANVYAAVESGVRHFDAALAGLGGCPFAPGATGNINTEDCVYLLQSLGFETGIDVGGLIALRAEVESWLPGERFSGAVFRSGLPKTFAAEAAA